jgi:sulfatase maturation enzyme AslB (radical SAM superfamily)
MTSDEIASSDEVDYEEAVEAISRQAADSRVEFFGGEPTIHPRFLDLVEAARRRGHQCSMATNGRTLADGGFIRRLAKLGSDAIYIRTTVYGDTAEVHDAYTNVRGSYSETIQGVRNAVELGFKVQVNTVILERNHMHLATIADQVSGLGASHIKFGNLVDVDSCADHAVPMSRVSPHLIRAIDVSERHDLSVTVEKTPICAIAGRIDLVSTERDLGQWPREYDDAGECRSCLVRPWCDGLDPGYVSVFGFEGIRSLDKVPALAIERCSERTPEFLKTHCVRVERELLDEKTAEHLNIILKDVASQHGRLAVFASRYVDDRDPADG